MTLLFLLVDMECDTSTPTKPSEAFLNDNVEKEMVMETKPTAFRFRPVSTTNGPRPAKSMKISSKTYPSK